VLGTISLLLGITIESVTVSPSLLSVVER